LAAYNEVSDGVENPDVSQSKKDDKSAVFGIDYKSEELALAVTYANFTQHEVDDEDNWIDGYGIEFYANYFIYKDVCVTGGINYQKPTGDYSGGYKFEEYYIGGSYIFAPGTLFAIEIKFTNSASFDFSKSNENVYGFAFYYEL